MGSVFVLDFWHEPGFACMLGLENLGGAVGSPA